MSNSQNKSAASLTSMKNNLAQATSASTSSKPTSILKNKKETLKDTSTTQTTL